MVDAQPDDARPRRIHQILADGVITGVRGEECHPVGGRQRQCGQLAIFLPGWAVGEIRRIVVGDQVLLGQDQAVTECAQERQIARVAQLKRPMDDVGADTERVAV